MMLRSPPLLMVLALGLSATGCKFGLDYSGDESGLTRKTLRVDGVEGRQLSYLIYGDATKPRVIFIHGSPGNSVMYADYLRELGNEAEVIAVDRLGYGKSQGDGVVVSFEEQAAAIAPLLEQREGRWPIVVGHSLGGPIASRLAADNPGKVGALVIVAGGLNAELEETTWYNEVAGWWIVSPFLADFLRTSNKEMWACREQVELLDPLLDNITCPVVVIHGTDDSLVPFEQIEYTIERMTGNPAVYVIVLIDEDHGVTKLRREEVRETIQELLAGLQDFVGEDS
jgi:pimeloyl-ACP methyl ester carboxylesterase